MSFLNDVGNFFTKEIPKFVTKTVPSVFEKDTYAPDLKPLRTSVERLKGEVQQTRDRFFAEQASLDQSEEQYRNLTERYANNAQAFDASQYTVSPSLIRELNDTQKTFRDIAKVSRTVSTVATLGLAELIYVHADIDEERRTLTRQKAILTGTKKRFATGVKKIINARKAFEAEIAKVKAELTAKGIEIGPSAASEATAAEARLAVRRVMAARLLGSGTDPATITELTGFSEDQLAEITPLPPEADDASEDASDLMTEDEKNLLIEAKG